MGVDDEEYLLFISFDKILLTQTPDVSMVPALNPAAHHSRVDRIIQNQQLWFGRSFVPSEKQKPKRGAGGDGGQVLPSPPIMQTPASNSSLLVEVTDFTCKLKFYIH